MASVRGDASPLNRRCAPPSPLRGRSHDSPLIPQQNPPLIPAPFDRTILPSLPPRWTGSRANGLRGQDRMEGVAPSLPKFRPAGCHLQRVVEGRQWCHGRFRAARGRSSPHGEPGCLRRNVRGFGSVDLDCGDKPPPSGGRSERSAGGQALRFRGQSPRSAGARWKRPVAPARSDLANTADYPP